METLGLVDRVLRDLQVLEELGVDRVTHLEVQREPAIEEDAQADAHVCADANAVVEVTVVRIDDGDGARGERADAGGAIDVVREDELLEARNFGITSLNEVREKLRERGLALRGE